jgi:hypothetical protein
VICAAVSLAEERATLVSQTPAPRTSGPLSVSMQQEVNAAMARSRTWLVACQNADGSWGELGSARLRLTAMAALTLVNSAAPDETKALESAKRWLGAPAAARDAAGDWEALSWQEIALQAILPPESLRTAALVQQSQAVTNVLPPFSRMLMQAAAPTLVLPPRATVTNAAAPALLDACLLAMNAPVSNLPQQPVLSQVAASWMNRPPPPAYTRTQQSWIVAHFINRAGGGSLADASGRLVNWRHDLANELVASQQIDPQRQGNGFWSGDAPTPSPSDAAIAATVYAVLALGEL